MIPNGVELKEVKDERYRRYIGVCKQAIAKSMTWHSHPREIARNLESKIGNEIDAAKITVKLSEYPGHDSDLEFYSKGTYIKINLEL